MTTDPVRTAQEADRQAEENRRSAERRRREEADRQAEENRRSAERRRREDEEAAEAARRAWMNEL